MKVPQERQSGDIENQKIPPTAITSCNNLEETSNINHSNKDEEAPK